MYLIVALPFPIPGIHFQRRSSPYRPGWLGSCHTHISEAFSFLSVFFGVSTVGNRKNPSETKSINLCEAAPGIVGKGLNIAWWEYDWWGVWLSIITAVWVGPVITVVWVGPVITAVWVGPVITAVWVGPVMWIHNYSLILSPSAWLQLHQGTKLFVITFFKCAEYLFDQCHISFFNVCIARYFQMSMEQVNSVSCVWFCPQKMYSKLHPDHQKFGRTTRFPGLVVRWSTV